MKAITDRAWLIPMGNVNATLLQGTDGELALVDAGFPGHEQAVFDAITAIGRRPEELAHLVFTHAHPDHFGSAAAIIERTGARTWMHPLDVPIAESGGPFRPLTASPGLIQKILFRIFFHADELIAQITIDEQFDDGQTLPVAGGLAVITTPGHCAGHASFLWETSRLLIVGDVGSNMLGLSDPLGFEDRAIGRASQRRLAGLEFEAASFGHGSAISQGAGVKVRKAWSNRAA